MDPETVPAGQYLMRIDRVPIVLMRKVDPMKGVCFRYATSKAEIDVARAQGYQVLESSFCVWKQDPEQVGCVELFLMEKETSQALVRAAEVEAFRLDGWQQPAPTGIGYVQNAWVDGTEGQTAVRSRYSFFGNRPLQALTGVLVSADEDFVGSAPYASWNAWTDFGALPVSTLFVRTEDGEPVIDPPEFGAGAGRGDVVVLPGTGRILRFRRAPNEPGLVLKRVAIDSTVKLLDLAGTVVGSAPLPTPITELYDDDEQILVLDENTSVVHQDPVSGHTVTSLQYEYTLHVEIGGVPHEIDPKVTNQSGGLRTPVGN